jgi:hypothetical protein
MRQFQSALRGPKPLLEKPEHFHQNQAIRVEAKRLS